MSEEDRAYLRNLNIIAKKKKKEPKELQHREHRNDREADVGDLPDQRSGGIRDEELS